MNMDFLVDMSYMELISTKIRDDENNKKELDKTKRRGSTLPEKN